MLELFYSIFEFSRHYWCHQWHYQWHHDETSTITNDVVDDIINDITWCCYLALKFTTILKNALYRRPCSLWVCNTSGLIHLEWILITNCLTIVMLHHCSSDTTSLSAWRRRVMMYQLYLQWSIKVNVRHVDFVQIILIFAFSQNKPPS